MYAVLQSGGKQYRVAPGDKIRVDTLSAEVGASVEFDSILAVSTDEGSLLLGDDVAKARVTGTVTAHDRAAKVLVFKFKRKKQYRRTQGHRQNYTEVKVDQVLV